MRTDSIIEGNKLETVSMPTRYMEMFCLGFCLITIVMSGGKLCGFLTAGFNLIEEISPSKATLVMQVIKISLINLLGLGMLLILLLKSTLKIKNIGSSQS